MKPDTRVYQLELFRFVAALIVVLSHYLYIGPSVGLYESPVGAAMHYAAYGSLGVEWFFIISGFIISMSAEGATTKAFLVGRFTRLFPVFWVACTLTWLVTSWSGIEVLQTSTKDYLVNLGMVLPVFVQAKAVDGVYWTLTYEWIFYAGVLVLLWLGQFNKRLSMYCSVWLLGSLAVMGLALLVPDRWFHGIRLVTAADYAPYFVAGICFYRIFRNTAARVDWVNLVFALLLMGMSLWLHQAENLANGKPTRSYAAEVAIVAFFNVAFLLVAQKKLVWLEKKVFAKVGALTFTFYLTHQNLGYVLITKLVPKMGELPSVCLTLMLSALLAYGLHHWIEKPLSSALRSRLLR